MKSQSNIAYIGLDLRSGHSLDVALQQIRLLEPKKPRAWFCDIVAKADQTPRAIEYQKLIRDRLETILPWEQYGDNIFIKINTDKRLRARERMNRIINAGAARRHQAPDVKFRDPSGKELPIEY